MRAPIATRSLAFLFSTLWACAACGADLAAAAARMDQDFAAGRPLVAHVVVALVDNAHQGIVPVPSALGDGAAPRTNLFEPPALAARSATPLPHASIVLACYSVQYLAPLLAEHSAHLIATSGLMAPEAYTLDAALERWFSGASAAQVRSAAAGAYARYQKISATAALRLFQTGSEKSSP